MAADVLACNRMPNDEVEVLDTWNVDSGRANTPDDIMDTFAYSTSVVDGRIMCR